MNRFLITIFLLVFTSLAQGQIPARGMPDCGGHGQRPQWGARVLNAHTVRFVVDATKVDRCTEYYDLEFTVELFGSQDSKIGRKLFAVPDTKISGPSVPTFDFSVAAEVARIEPIALNCKKRFVGGSPSPSLEKQNSQLPRMDFPSLDEEAPRIHEWSDIELDYTELDYIQSSDKTGYEMQCSSGELTRRAKQGDVGACAEVLANATRMKQRRQDQYGAAVLPNDAK